MNNSTVALNHLTATAGTTSGNGTAQGGGLFLGNSSPSTLTDATVAGNKVSASGGGTLMSQGGGLYAGSMTSLLSTIIGTNSAPPSGGPDCFGGPTSAGYNLIGNKTGCTWVSAVGDKTNKNPQFGTLRNNGGPTQTIGIKATSPAHNAVPTGVCPFHTDQRGIHRPQGSKCDMGAFELKVGETVKSALGLVSSTVRSAGGTESGAISPAATLPRAIILRVLGHSLPSPFAVSRRFPGPSRAAIHAQAIQYAKQKLAWARMVSR
jgi:hypothetical protein